MGDFLSWHKPGQKVVCVNKISDLLGIRNWPVVGGIYTVRRVEFAKDGTAFCLEEVVNRKNARWSDGSIGEASFYASHFRPAKETNIDCFLSLLNPSPDTVRKLENVG